MIRNIDDLIVPATLSSVAEKFNQDKVNRTVSMRQIRKLSPNEKWRITLNYGTATVPKEFQLALYEKCKYMRRYELPITFVNPYTFEEVTAYMTCTSSLPPKVLYYDENDNPKFYGNVGATFEEV